MQGSKRNNRGFTLVEMSIVVAIIGVLSALAVVGYRKLILSSHVAEATHMIGAIRSAQESYHAEVGTYANISSTLNNYCPTHSTWPSKTAWNPSCNGGTAMTWAALPLHADAPMSFGYATVAGRAGDAAVAAPTGMLTTPALTPVTTSDWFVISARGDMDGNGTFCTAVGVSWTSEIYVDREGE